jgi:hypothetical protein
MRGVASAQISPGAQTCIVVGDVDTSADLDLSGYRSVLWITREPASSRLALDPSRTQLEAVNRLDPTHTLASVEKLIRRDGLRLPSVIVTDEAMNEAPEPYLPVIETIFSEFESQQRARTTRQRDGFTWQSHLLANLPALTRRRVPSHWAGALHGLPAFICGAGPSLDASLPALRAFAGHSVIFAADSALRALARVYVTADFAVSVDAHKTPEKCLVPGHASAGRMIVAGISPPDWQYSVAEHKLHFLSGRQITEDRLVELGIEKTALGVEENCGITALALALHLGCGPIYLFGMDHAVDSKNPARWHQSDAPAGADQQIGFTAERSYPKVPGNYQAEIATPLYREWRSLDERCAALPADLVYNVTDRGARLRNTTVVSPDVFWLSGAIADKAPRLGLLAAPEAILERDWRRVRDALTDLALEAQQIIAQARGEFQAGRTQVGAELLSRAFRDKRFSLLFGNYSLKIIPHLVRFGEVEPALWTQLLDECGDLVTLALNTR